MAVRVVCPKCNTNLQLAELTRERSIRCGRCSHVFVPAPDAKRDEKVPVLVPYEPQAGRRDAEVPRVIAATPPVRPAPSSKGKYLVAAAVATVCLGLVLLVSGAATVWWFEPFSWKETKQQAAADVVIPGEQQRSKKIIEDNSKQPAKAKTTRQTPEPKKLPPPKKLPRIDDGAGQAKDIAAQKAPKKNENLAFQSTPERKKIVIRGKAATAMVDVGRKTGSAFCIHEGGFFITNEHVIRNASGSVRLVLQPGTGKQKVVTAKVVRKDKDLDLALLQVTGPAKFTALPLGADSDADTLTDLIAFGFPFGKLLAVNREKYPVISVHTGRVTSLRKKDGKLHRIQLDAVLNPGNSGGPVVDAKGNVVGVVVSGISGGAQLNFAIPIDHVKQFADRPTIQFTPPAIQYANRHKPVQFEASATSLIPSKAALQLELILQSKAEKERRLKMVRQGASYRVTAVPVSAAQGPAELKASIHFEKGLVQGIVLDRVLKMGSVAAKLSDIRELTLSPKPQVTLHGGKTHKVAPAKDVLNVQLGGMAVQVDLAKASRVEFEPLERLDAVTCIVVAHKNGKEIARIDNVLSLGDAPQVATGPPRKNGNFQIPPARLGREKTIKKLPGTIANVAVGGGGRYLILHLSKLRQLAVFDVSELRIVKMLPMAEDHVFFAAGQHKLMVILPTAKVIQRWDLATGMREEAAPLGIQNPLFEVAMGCASEGPLLVGEKSRFRSSMHFIDIHTMQTITYQTDRRHRGFDDNSYIRASADGTTFSGWRTSTSPQGVTAMVITGDRLAGFYEHKSAGHVIPGRDGKVLYTGRGMYTYEAKPIGNAGDNRAPYCLPAVASDFYMKIGSGNLRFDAPSSVTIYMHGQDRALITVKADLPKEINSWAREKFGADKRIHYIPNANVLITIPETNDRLIVHRLDILEAMKKTGIDYLFVTSRPLPVAYKGNLFNYRIVIQSRKGGVQCKLESGPKSMTVSADGVLNWQPPNDFAGGEAAVIVSIRDRTGQEIYHSFRLAVRDLP